MKKMTKIQSKINKEVKKINDLRPKFIIDISTELWRSYRWLDGTEIKIHRPKKVFITENGHRILDSYNNGHYIPKGWIYLYWKNRKNAKGIVG